MTVTITGTPPSVERLITGWHTFDRMFSNSRKDIGLPLRQITEIYGMTSTGKTTVTMGICGRINKGTIAMADLEGQDPQFLVDLLEAQNFNGNLEFIYDIEDEKILTKLRDIMTHEDVCAGILDSVGAISSMAENEGDIGEANMGKRGLRMAQFSRGVIKAVRMRKTPAIVFMINHIYANLGFMGTTTPGGTVKKFLSQTRIKIKNPEKFEEGSYIVELTTEKNRFGFVGQTGYLFVLAGKGIHDGMTAVTDCIATKTAEKSRTVNLNGKSYGYMSSLIKEAQDGNKEIFQPFIQALRERNS